MTKIEAVQVIKDATEQGVDFAEIERRLAAGGLSVPEMVDAYREAGRHDLAEAEALVRFWANRR